MWKLSQQPHPHYYFRLADSRVDRLGNYNCRSRLQLKKAFPAGGLRLFWVASSSVARHEYNIPLSFVCLARVGVTRRWSKLSSSPIRGNADRLGKCELKDLPAGLVMVTATAPGYDEDSVPVDLADGETFTKARLEILGQTVQQGLSVLCSLLPTLFLLNNPGGQPPSTLRS
jgi:hypothetical protein